MSLCDKGRKTKSEELGAMVLLMCMTAARETTIQFHGYLFQQTTRSIHHKYKCVAIFLLTSGVPRLPPTSQKDVHQ